MEKKYTKQIIAELAVMKGISWIKWEKIFKITFVNRQAKGKFGGCIICRKHLNYIGVMN